MKIGIFEKPGVLKLSEREEPVLKNDGDVLIKVRLVGICGSDMHVMHGRHPVAVYPRVWGHEVVGQIEETGSAVTRVAVGDRIVIEPIIYCGHCYACRSGRPNVCVNLQVLGLRTDGGCQEYIVLSEKNVHKLPEKISWEEGVLIEPFTIGAQAVMRGSVMPGDIVLVMGTGSIGLSAMKMAKIAGATVIVTDVVDQKLAFARDFGADYAINAKTENVFDRVMEITEGMGSNVTIDTACTDTSLGEAVKITSAAGRVVNLSFGNKGVEIAPVQLTGRELTICGSRLQTNRFPVVIELLEKGELNLSGFLTDIYPIDKMVEAFQFADEHPEKVRKLVVSFA